MREWELRWKTRKKTVDVMNGRGGINAMDGKQTDAYGDGATSGSKYGVKTT